MKRTRSLSLSVFAFVMVSAGLAVPSSSFGEEQTIIQDQKKTIDPAIMPAFPPSDKCTSSSPCRHVAGQITRIEESYWVKLPNGDEMHLKATQDAKMDKLPKVGDRIAAQITSTGEVQAMTRLQEIPKPAELPVPQKSMQDLR